MDLIFEQECPQCGAVVELTESDHLLPCPYCGTTSFLVAKGHWRFVLPPKVTGTPVYYIPYLRFRGSIYTCHGDEVSYKIMDITNCGVPGEYFPRTLGLRPQAMKMKLASPEQPGAFIKSRLKLRDILDSVDKRVKSAVGGKVAHRAFIGETVSIIYLPAMLREDRLYDGITNNLLPKPAGDFDIQNLPVEPDNSWKPQFMATICPACGWNLEGERDSIILACKNCETFWTAKNGRFVKMPYLSVSAPSPQSEYLPFWKIEVNATGINLDSFNDFLLSTKQPRLPIASMDPWPMGFLVPAFKIKPKAFLRISTQLTLGQMALKMEEAFPERPFHRINLAYSEAVQSMKIVLTAAAVNKKEIISLLPEIKFNIRNLSLVFIPFTNSGYGLFQEHCRVNINRQVLKYGGTL